MFLKFLKSKLFILFSVILFTAFTIGYDYAVVTSREPSAPSSGIPAAPSSGMPAATASTSVPASESKTIEKEGPEGGPYIKGLYP